MKTLARATLALLCAPALAQTGPAPSLPEVTVSTPRGAAPLFDAPASVDLVEGRELREDRLQINLSEGLAGVPGLQIQNRQNYAQDLQLSVRGFGARSTFGVRGVRLYVDGIPATLPDGQGQTSNIDIGSADRIEVLRGPFSALYGNSSGGVVQVFTEDGEGPPKPGYSFAAGSDGTLRQSTRVSGSSGAVDYLLSGSHFTTDGYREHSAARRNLVNGKLGIALGEDGRLTLVVNSVHLSAQDPLGLTASQVALAPRSAPLAVQFDTRKTVEQTQLGLVYEKRIDADNGLRLLLYGGERKTTQFQSIPPAAQISALSAGGRDRAGAPLRRFRRALDRAFATRRRPVRVERRARLRHPRRGSPGLGQLHRPRLGARLAGRAGQPSARRAQPRAQPRSLRAGQLALRRALDAGGRPALQHRPLQVGRPFHPRRQRRRQRQRALSPRTAGRGAALCPHARPQPLHRLRRGYETPTLNELSYRPDGRAGLNFGLLPSVNDSVEVGAKARLAGGLLTAALFETRTRDEIVTATNSGGRATFRKRRPHAAQGLRTGLDARDGRPLAHPGRADPASTRATTIRRSASAFRASRDSRCSPPSAGCRRRAGTPAPNCAR